jgi:SAM-dependent methyltransferase
VSGAITYLSPPAAVRMADAWFDVASPEHFWMQRRFEVLWSLARTPLQAGGSELAEIGCGNGVLLRQLRARLGRSVHGFDLNGAALECALEADPGLDLFCYDVHTRRPELRERYDGILLFDVIEHLEDDLGLVESAIYHLRPGGHLYLNLPALTLLMSVYDEVAGHYRRYSVRGLRDLVARAGLTLRRWTYWALPLLPLGLARRVVLAGVPRERVIDRGFRPPGRLANACLRLLTRCEWIPQHLLGCSLMAVLQKPEVA